MYTHQFDIDMHCRYTLVGLFACSCISASILSLTSTKNTLQCLYTSFIQSERCFLVARLHKKGPKLMLLISSVRGKKLTPQIDGQDTHHVFGVSPEYLCNSKRFYSWRKFWQFRKYECILPNLALWVFWCLSLEYNIYHWTMLYQRRCTCARAQISRQ